MVASGFFIENAPHSFLRYIYNSPFQSLLAIVTAICVFTRLLTGIQNVISQTHAERPVKRASTVPYWVPFVGSAVSFAMDIQGTIAKGRWVPKTPLVSLDRGLTRAETRLVMASCLIGLAHHNTMCFTCPRS